MGGDERTREGVVYYRMRDLRLERDRSPALARSWTVMPPIDESSPLHGATPETLARDEVERSVPPPRAHLADAGVPLPALNALHDEGHLRLDGDDRGCERRAAGSAVARATTSLPVPLSPVSARCSGSV